MFICVDFDGTIVDHRFPDIGPEVPFAIYWIKIFQKFGARIILWTMRSDDPSSDRCALTDAVGFIQEVGVKLYGVNENPSQKKWTSSPKAYGHCYIDDAAVGCPLMQIEGFYRPCVDWSIVGPIVKGLLNA